MALDVIPRAGEYDVDAFYKSMVGKSPAHEPRVGAMGVVFSADKDQCRVWSPLVDSGKRINQLVCSLLRIDVRDGANHKAIRADAPLSLDEITILGARAKPIKVDGRVIAHGTPATFDQPSCACPTRHPVHITLDASARTNSIDVQRITVGARVSRSCQTTGRRRVRTDDAPVRVHKPADLHNVDLEVVDQPAQMAQLRREPRDQAGKRPRVFGRSDSM